MSIKKRILAAAIACTMLVPAVCLPMAACGDDDNTGITTPEKNVTSIKLDISNVKTVFEWDETFTYDGLKVLGVYADGTEEELPLSECTVSTPDMQMVGKRVVQVTYKGRRTNYQIEITEPIMPEINTTPVFAIEGANPETSYKVEGEDIDMATPAAKPNGGEFVVETDDSGVSGGKYLANYGSAGNYFGFTFTAEQEYKNATLVLRVMNPQSETLSIGSDMELYLNYENKANKGELEIESLAVLAPAATAEGEAVYTWEDRVIRGITIPEGTNSISVWVKGSSVACLDYMELYVGKVYEGNRINLTEEGVAVKEFEDFNLEKIVVRQDIVDAYGLKPGEAFIETPKKNLENTSGGHSVGAVVAGTEISTLICLNERATIELFLTAAYPISYRVKDNWEFYIDGVRLRNVESKDIAKGDYLQEEWYEWEDTSLGMVDLEAGNHLFVAKVVSGSANFDCFKFDVKTYGSFLDRVEGDLIMEDIAEGNNYVVEAETLDNSEVITRSDFINAGYAPGTYATGNDDNASGGMRIYGFDKGTKFYFTVYATEDCTVNITLTGYGASGMTVGNNLSFTLDGTELILPENEGDMGATSLTLLDLAEGVQLSKGRHTFVLEVISKGFDFDCITFSVTGTQAE